MKLTKIESYEIQAFAFRVMTGYVAPGKDPSPMADEASYEERCAAWDEWRNKYAPCILAMLHGFEALIDRDDEPTGLMLDACGPAEETDPDVVLHDCRSEIYRLQERIAELERDAERYLWLRENTYGVAPAPTPTVLHIVHIDSSSDWRSALDDAIDAAIKEERK